MFIFSYGGLKRKLFQTELKEYLHAVKYNKHTSSFATHIPNTGHIYGDTRTQWKYYNVKMEPHINTIKI
jgi:hypothetical protein